VGFDDAIRFGVWTASAGVGAAAAVALLLAISAIPDRP
jgi:hypothetical protein